MLVNKGGADEGQKGRKRRTVKRPKEDQVSARERTVVGEGTVNDGGSRKDKRVEGGTAKRRQQERSVRVAWPYGPIL